MDLSRRDNLSVSEKMEIATAMHAILLNGIFADRRWRTPQAVFHGGTALSFQHQSGRFSEDLDFMLGEEAYGTIEKNMRRVAEELSVTMSMLYAGGKVSVSGPKGKTVQTWFFDWEHPNRRGKVKVKTEFLLTSQDVLRQYKTLQVIPFGKWHAAVNIEATIPAPALISSWADKIVAVASRPDFKWRDAYDLAFLHLSIPGGLTKDTDRFQALTATMNIYHDITFEGLLAGLDRDFVTASLSDPEKFEADMQDWLPKERWQHFKDNGMFQERLALAKFEVERARALIVEHQPANGMTP